MKTLMIAAAAAAALLSTGASAQAQTTTANTPAGDAPSSYPPCTSKMQDRCTQGGKAMKMKMKHHKA